MKQNIVSILLVLTIVLGSVSTAFAVDTVKLDSMDSGKSVGYVGVMNLTETSTQDPVKGLCVEKGEYINFGDKVPYQDGTGDVPESNSVKKLIVQNYRDNMTPQEGKDLQEAIWWYTDGITPTSAGAKAMIAAADADSSTIPDSGYSVVVSTTKKLISTTITEEIIPLNAVSNSSSEITKVNEETSVEEVVSETCVKTITTVVEYFNKHTTIDTITTFQKTITTINVYEITKNLLTFDFDQAVNKRKQDLILFTATPSSETSQEQTKKVEREEFNLTSQSEIDTPFNVTKITETCKPIIEPEPVDPGQPVEAKTVPMQKTGANIVPMLLALLGVGTTIGIARLRR